MTNGTWASDVESPSQAGLRAARKTRKVLVVEDERVVALDIRRTLEELGYEVCSNARSSQEALAQAAANDPDLVLMDIRIKGPSDGIETAMELKLRHNVAVVFLTASTDEGTLQRAFRSQPDGYLRKPYTTAGLRTALEVALQRHGVESQLRELNDELAVQKAELAKRAGDLGLLCEMGDMLLLCDDVEEVLAIVSRFGEQLFADNGALFLVDGSGGRLSASATWGQGAPRDDFDLDGCRALRGGQTHRVLPSAGQLWCAHVDPGATLASICVPMVTSGTSLGVLCLTFPTTEHLDRASMRAREQLSTVAAQRISLTLANLRIRDQLKRESMLDPLTGLFNRRFMVSAFDRELRIASRNNRSMGIIMLDLDDFKLINDEFGHAGADTALSEVANFLRLRLRASDLATRVGGDEMVVILPDTSIDGARTVAENLRQGIRELIIEYRGRTLPRLTVSVGVAAYPLHGSDTESILRAADVSLYKAKAGGRDCVVVAEADAARRLGEGAGMLLTAARDARASEADPPDVIVDTAAAEGS